MTKTWFRSLWPLKVWRVSLKSELKPITTTRTTSWEVRPHGRAVINGPDWQLERPNLSHLIRSKLFLLIRAYAKWLLGELQFYIFVLSSVCVLCLCVCDQLSARSCCLLTEWTVSSATLRCCSGSTHWQEVWWGPVLELQLLLFIIMIIYICSTSNSCVNTDNRQIYHFLRQFISVAKVCIVMSQVDIQF